MKPVEKSQIPLPVEDHPEVFDRAHLARYTMDSIDLEKEIVGLFLTQLPETLAMIRNATEARDWKLATHSLKGAAAAVGARRIGAVAAQLEQVSVDDHEPRFLLTQDLAAAAAEFRALAERIYA